MKKFFLPFLSIVALGLSFWIADFYSSSKIYPKPKEEKIAPSPKETEGKTLGRYTASPQIYISGEGEYSFGGVFSLTSFAEPSIQISSFNISGTAQVEIYQTNEEALLNYLLHNQKGFQIKKEPDSNQLQYITAINHEVTLGYGKESKLLLPLSESGIWFLKVKLGTANASAFIIRSSIGAIVKEGDNEYIFWGYDFKTKRSLSVGTIRLYNLLEKSQEIFSTNLDEEGISKTPLLEEADIALVSQGEEKALIPLNLRYLNTESNYRLFQAKTRRTKYFVFTDRPLYRPGDKVYFKAVLRDDDDASYTIPSGSALVKVYRDWNEQDPLFEKNYPISTEGTIWGEYQIPSEGKTGYYQLKVEIPGSDPSYWSENLTSFQVEYFRKPEYSIEISTSTTELIAQDKASFKISGNYFFGQPLANQKVKYKIWSGDFYEYSYNQDSFYLSDDYRWGWWGGKNLKEEEVVFNSKGEAEVDLDTKYPGEIGKSQVFSIEAEFDDGSGNPSFARKNILVYSGEYGIYQKDANYLVKVGTPLSLSLVLKPRRNTNVSGITLKAKVHRENWVPYQKADEKYPSYQKEEEDLPELTTKTDTLGNASFSLVPQKVGSYRFTVFGEDSKGNNIVGDFYFWVTSEDYSVYSGDSSNLNILADKSEYSPGQKANLIIFSEIPNRDLFLSFERGRVHRFKVIHLDGKKTQIEVPILEEDMPNIFANVSGFSFDSFEFKELEINVSTKSKKMNVAITPNKLKFTPGEEVILNIQTTDFGGNPVSADLAIWAVDKALFELLDKKPPQIFTQFWQKRGNATKMAHSLEGISVLTAEGGGGGGGEAREIFKDTAYWNPSVKTDSNGQAQVKFKLPDNLTTWVIFGLGSTKDTKAGQNTAEVVVSKDLVIRPVLPNILYQGDKIFLSAFVHNFSELNQKLSVEFKFEEGEVKPNTPQHISLKGKDFTQVFWEVKPLKESEKAKLIFSVKSLDDEKIADSVKLEIPIRPFGFWEKNVQVGEGNKNFSLKFFPDTDKEKSVIILSLSPSILGTLKTAMTYLVDYPYGCVEQTTSYLVPTLIVKENPNLFASSSIEKDIDAIIKKGIKRLTSLQNLDGGWRWWRQGNSNPFVTAYVVEYLLKAKHLGINVDEEVFSKAKNYLEQENYYDYEKKKEVSYGREDWIAKSYALSLIGSEKGKKFLSDLDGLSPDYLALAVMTNLKNGYKNSSINGLSKLISLAQPQGEAVWWDKGDKRNFGSQEASTALALRAILASGEYSEMATKAARFLARNRKSEYWANTFGTAQVIQAMVDFSKNTQESSPNYTYKVFLGEKEIAQGTVNDSRQAIPEIKISLKELKSNEASLRVEKFGEGELYSTLLLNEFRTDKKAKAKESGMWIKREYLNSAGGNSLTVGDKVTVKLTIGGLSTSEYYGIIEDFLPSGLIPINPRFKSEQYGETPNSSLVMNQEITENGAILSLYKVEPGERTYTYEARVIAEGEFTVLPANSSLMYAPEINSRSEIQKIKVGKESKLLTQPSGLKKQIFENFFVSLWKKILELLQRVFSFLKHR